MEPDPFAVLGVDRHASADELRAARRRLALDTHPDRHGGDGSRMRELNLALDAALATVAAEAVITAPPTVPPPPARTTSASSAAPSRQGRGRVVHDVASFTIEALPAEAFEALLVVSTWLGEVLVDDPPYLLEMTLGDPFRCWCRLDLVPDAGASTVSLTLAGLEGPPADLDDVRDAWVANLNLLGRPM